MYIFSENSEELNLPGYFASLNILKADLQSVNLMMTLVCGNESLLHTMEGSIAIFHYENMSM